MKTAILVHNDPGSTGGYQTLSRYLAKALNADIIVGRQRFYKDDYDYFIGMDDYSVYRMPLDRPHTAYLTTPRRSAYDLYYLNGLDKKLITIPFRIIDQFMMGRVTDFVAISHTVRTRIYKTYGKEAHVIYPCIEVNKFKGEKSSGRWLAVQRIAKWKRIEMIVEAFKDMPDKTLCLFGELYDKKYERFIFTLPPNVFWACGDDEYLRKKYATCEGVITMGVDEDFGIVPLEAFASGKHVIAPAEGGYLETVHGVGKLIPPTKQALKRAVRSYEETGEQTAARLTRAKEFDYDMFRRRWIGHAMYAIEKFYSVSGPLI